MQPIDCGIAGFAPDLQLFATSALSTLKDSATPLPICEVVYQRNDPAVMLNRTPFVGRTAQLKRLSARLADARNGHGSIAMLRGEPGIGKSRTIEEFAEQARQQGAMVLHGACYDGEWQPPYTPLAEAIMDYARHAERAEFMAALGRRASIIARIAPALHDIDRRHQRTRSARQRG